MNKDNEQREKSNRAIRKCAYVMAYMLQIGWTKEDLPRLEEIFWDVRDWRTGEVKRMH